MPASSSPSAEHARAISSRVRATSYGASSSSQMRCARRRLRERRPRVTLGERDRPLGVRDDRVQHRALVLLRELAQLEAGRPRFLDLARGEGDLDVGGEQRRSLERLRDLGTWRGESPRARRRASPARGEVARDRAEAPSRSGSHRDTPPRLPRTRRAAAGARPAGRARARRRVLRLHEALGREPRLLERLRP